MISIVGRFLEHSRIYYFHAGGREEYFIGSADAMRRNLSTRVEVLAPVEDPEIRGKLRTILDLQLNDRRNCWEMQPDGSYVQRMPGSADEALGSQEALMRWTERKQKKAAKVRKRKPRVLGPGPGTRRR